jgi:uncharacterized protein
MKCPSCAQALLMAERNGVEIDYCPQCRGVWLDRGELDKIIEQSSAQGMGYAEKTQPSRPIDRSSSQYYPHRKNKSFLGEIFDFD